MWNSYLVPGEPGPFSPAMFRFCCICSMTESLSEVTRSRLADPLTAPNVDVRDSSMLMWTRRRWSTCEEELGFYKEDKILTLTAKHYPLHKNYTLLNALKAFKIPKNFGLKSISKFWFEMLKTLDLFFKLIPPFFKI